MVQITALTEPNRSSVSFKILKPYTVPTRSSLGQFSLNLREHLKIKGQGINIDSELPTLQELEAFYFLEVDDYSYNYNQQVE